MQALIQLERNKRWAPNGPMDYARSARRYKFEPTPHAPVFYSKSLGIVLRRHDGQVHYASQADAESVPSMTGEAVVKAEDIQNDLEYICPVTIGTPGVTLRLDFDTGSADLWVWSSKYRSSQSSTEERNFYDPSQSTTSQEAQGLTWEIMYGDRSSASGNEYTDKVAIGDIAIPNQAVEIAQNLSSSFLGDESDGLLGLALSGNTIRDPQGQAPQKTPVQNMIEQGLLDHPVFTVKLDKLDSNGFYTFGYIDSSVTNNPILYTTVKSSSDFWEFPSATFKLGSKTYQRAPGNTAIADTGTSLILLDDTAVATLYSTIPGANLDSTQNGYIFPTSAASSIPDISFAVGENMFSIPGKDLVWADVGNGMSYGSIQSRGTNDQDILGDVFLKRVYAVFEQSDTPRIGFAQRDY